MKIYRKNNKEKINILHKNWIKKNKDKVHIYKNKQRKKNPIKHHARRFGYLKRKDKCSMCKSNDKLEFHHTDYINNDGFTLCQKCHKKIHKEVLK